MTAQPAVGIHAHPTLKLGLRPKDPTNYARAIPFGEHVAAIPLHPITVDDTSGIAFGMDGNDQAGDCVVAGWDHFQVLVRQLLTGSSTPMTLLQIEADYRTQNPDFRFSGDPAVNGPGSPADGGMVIQTFLEYLQKAGRILGFASVDHTQPEQVKAAVYLGLGLIGGYTLQTAQQHQTVFDYVPGSGVWGGHCMAEGGYNATRNVEVTWGTTQASTPAFQLHCCDELWFVILAEHVSHPGFRAGFDLASFAAAFTELTGRPFPVPVAPTPPPVPVPVPPSPAPPPGPAAGFPGALVAAAAAAAADPDVTEFLGRRHVGVNAEVARRLRAVLAAPRA